MSACLNNYRVDRWDCRQTPYPAAAVDVLSSMGQTTWFFHHSRSGVRDRDEPWCQTTAVGYTAEYDPGVSLEYSSAGSPANVRASPPDAPQTTGMKRTAAAIKVRGTRIGLSLYGRGGVKCSTAVLSSKATSKFCAAVYRQQETSSNTIHRQQLVGV